MTDIEIFCTELYKYDLKTKVFDDFYDKIKDLDCLDFRLHFFKALWFDGEFKKGLSDKELIKKAIDEIETAIDSVDKVVSGKKAHIDNSYYLTYQPPEGGGLKPLHRIVLKSDVYYLAGQIYAKAKDEAKSLEYYQIYQYYIISKPEPTIEKNAVVYSFRKYSEYSLSDLINNKITVCHPSVMNDPFDSVATLWCTPDILEIGCDDTSHLKTYIQSFDYYRIRSFVANKETFDKDDAILKNILMWSHYTEGHTGFCIKYSLSKHFVKQEENEKIEHMYLKPVDYSSQEVNIKTDSMDANLGYATKYKCWEYEKEVRLISYNTATNEKHLGIPLDDASKIEAIYFGYKCKEEYKETIRNILKGYKNDIEVYCMEIDKGNVYNLKIERQL